MPASAGRLDAYKHEIAAFAAKLNRDPSEPDLRWLFLNQRMISLAQSGAWGLYRNTRMDMAAMLQQEGRLRDALRTFLEVCYMDLHGIITPDPDSPEKLPRCQIDLGVLAPRIVDQVFNLMKLLRLSENDVHREFSDIASRVHKNLKLPLAPEEVWKRLWPDLVND